MKHLLKSYNIQPIEIDKLAGYISNNYKIRTDKNEWFVFKHYTDLAELELIHAENKLLEEISSELSYQIPAAIDRGGFTVHQHNDQTFSRLVPYIEGKFLDEVGHTDELLYNFGQAIAEMDSALEGKRISVIESRKIIWDIQHSLLNKLKANFIQEPDRRKLVDFYFDQFEQFALPQYQNLRYSIIHGDMNIQNVLTDGSKISGVIDFGDMCYSLLVNELAVALTYIMFEKEEPIRAAQNVIRGYTHYLKKS